MHALWALGLLAWSGCFLVGYEGLPLDNPGDGGPARIGADGKPVDAGGLLEAPRPKLDAGKDASTGVDDAATAAEAGIDAGHDAGTLDMDAGPGEGGVDPGIDGGGDVGDASSSDASDGAPMDAGDAAAHPTDGSTEGGTPPPDAATADAGDSDAGFTDICQLPLPCTFDCSGAPYCSVNCNLGTTCTTACVGTEYCKALCGWGATCNFDCRNTGRCHPTCSLTSTCDIDCRGSDRCDEVRCEFGAACLVRCTAGRPCSFDYCPSGALSCQSGYIACGRPCPP